MLAAEVGQSEVGTKNAPIFLDRIGLLHSGTVLVACPVSSCRRLRETENGVVDRDSRLDNFSGTSV